MYHWEALRKQQVVDRKYAALKRLEEKKVGPLFLRTCGITMEFVVLSFLLYVELV